LQFAKGAAYSYVVLVGTGRESFGRGIHGAQIAPLLDVLLKDLQAHAAKSPMPTLLPLSPPPAPSVTAPTPVAGSTVPPAEPTARATASSTANARAEPDWRQDVFRTN
jgi:hypothetical protein